MLSPVNAFAIANLLKLLQLNVNGALFIIWGCAGIQIQTKYSSGTSS